MTQKTSAHFQQGFTLVELLVVLAMFVIVFALTNVSLSGMIASNSTQEFTETFISDLNRQQNRAMTGETASGSATSYGVKFYTDKYLLFGGAAFSATNSSNITVPLPKDLTFQSNTLPQQQIIFAENSGEVVGYVATASSVQLRNTTTNAVNTFQFNSLGVITTTP